jgi:predicted PurR-regulated permease PerM
VTNCYEHGGDPLTTHETDSAPNRETEEPEVTIRRIEIDGKIIWQTIGALFLTAFLWWAFNQASTIVAMVAIAFFFSLALDPGVRWLVGRYGWRRGSATGVVYLVGAVFTILMVVILIPSLVQLAQLIGEKGAEWMASLDGWINDTFGTDPDLVSEAGTVEGVGDALGDFSADAFGTLLGAAASGVSFVFNLATVAMFTFYFTAAMPQVQRAVLRVFSPEAQQKIGWTWDKAIVQTGGYFYSRLLLMFVNGIGFFFTMLMVGLDPAISVSLALFGSFVSVFIPVIGTYIGGAVPILLSLAIEGWTAGLIVLAYVLIYQQIENYWLSPKLSAKTMSLNAGVSFGAALAGGAIAGPMGAFTALPIAALITSFLSNFVASHEVVYRPDEDVEPAPHSDESDDPVDQGS